MENVSQILIYLHAGFGGIALLAGVVALFARKGNKLHKKAGLLFYYPMLFSALLAFIIAVIPGHQNAFLFSIGLFSTYFLIAGKRSLSYKNKNHNYEVDKWLAYGILITGITMIIYPLLLEGVFNIVLLVFGVVGLLFGIRDIINLRDLSTLSKKWLKMHIGKMMGGYIAAVSAFFVVNEILPGLYNWFAPGIVGSAYITYWMFKLNTNRPKSLVKK